MSASDAARRVAGSSRMLPFVKMHGLGNDYVLVDASDGLPTDLPTLARAMSDRNVGVGSDGLIAVVPPTAGADFRMAIWNADGSDGGLCINGMRCAVRWLRDRGLLPGAEGSAETGAGPVAYRIDDDSNDVEVLLGRPHLRPDEIPVLADGDRVVAEPFELPGSIRVLATAVSVGNPHLVIRCGGKEGPTIDDVVRLGPSLETHPRMPERANVHFVETVAPRRLRQRSWERGSGLTRACGSGAAATAVAWGMLGEPRGAYAIDTDGGTLEVEWRDDDRVRVRGPATPVFEGGWPLEAAP